MRNFIAYLKTLNCRGNLSRFSLRPVTTLIIKHIIKTHQEQGINRNLKKINESRLHKIKCGTYEKFCIGKTYYIYIYINNKFNFNYANHLI